MNFVHHTIDAVQSILLRSLLALHADYRKACTRKARQRYRCVERVRAPPDVSLPLASWPLSGVSEDYTSTLEKHGSLSTGNRKRVASIVSQH